MGNVEKASRRAKRGVDQALALHRELNPHPGRPILVAMDSATGQLFFCSRRGKCYGRDAAAAARHPDALYALERGST